MSTSVSASVNPETVTRFLNIAAYKFVALEDLEKRRASLREVVNRENLRGTILLTPEGINLFLAGQPDSVGRFLKALRSLPELTDLEVKESYSDHQPFNRMLIKIKSEIIAFGIDGCSPLHTEPHKLAAKDLQRWLSEGRKVHLLDTRNDYEVEVGTFQNAIPAGIDHFRDFPEAVSRLPQEMKDEPIVMFCTGGIRCEKAGPYMEQAGFNQVYQLDGGILKYFEECGGDFYDGDCFVFDQRVAVDPNLQETQHTQCYVCQDVVAPEQQTDSRYVPGQSCPACFREPHEKLQARIADLNLRLQAIVTPLPGSQPYFNKRPLNVPERYAGLSLIDFLCEWHPQVGREEWQQRIQNCRIVPGARYGRRKRKKTSPEETLPLDFDRVVRNGERFEHLLPKTVEPDVHSGLQIIHDDDQFVVLNKPAPLPMHASGRFHRNTVNYILQKLYFPEHPLPAHRLDANTSGVLLFCRKRKVAKIVQPQFEQRTVKKRYLARVLGRPSETDFACELPISAEPGPGGVRVIDVDAGLKAATTFKHVHTFDDGTSLLEVMPLTGRTNQIRIHLWHMGLPILGDPAYLPNRLLAENRTLSLDEDPMCLHASSLIIHDPQGNQRMFQAPDPTWAEIA